MDLSGLVVTGLGLCFEVASTLYSYGKQVKGARKEIQILTNELFGLIGALEHVKSQQEKHALQEKESCRPPEYMNIDNSDTKTRHGNEIAHVKDSHQPKITLVLEQTVEFLQELQQSLGVPKGRLNAAVHLMKWPLRESEVQRHLTRLERVKTFFVLTLVTDDADQSRKTANEITALRTLVQDASIRQQAIESRKEHQACMEWLSPVDPSAIRRSIERTRMPGTCTWFTQSEPFLQQSQSAQSSCLWLNGITGAGKTTIMTAAIDALLKCHEGRFDFAYFYCSFSNDESLHTQNILGSILAQIMAESEVLYGEIRSKFAEISAKSTSKPARLGVEALVDLLVRQAQSRKGIYVAIDAVNECSDPFELLHALSRILKSTTGVQLLISSIHEKGIGKAIDSIPSSYEITVSPKDIRSDVNLLVYSALENNPRLKVLPQDLKDDIGVNLTDRAEGM